VNTESYSSLALPDWLTRQARRGPDRPALIDPPFDTWTWAQLHEMTEAMAGAGRFLGTRLPRLTDLALLLLEFQREVGVPDVPAFLVRLVLAPLAWLARRRRRPVPA